MAGRQQAEKPSTTHIETFNNHESTNDTKRDANSEQSDANEDIVRHLQTTGEDVGLTSRTLMAAVSMAMCYNAYLFTLLIPPAILTYINADLGPDPRYTWITISWNLGGAMFVTVGGRLSDIFGRRYFFIAGAIILIIGSIISATGQSINQMIAGGALFGCGSGFLEMAFGAVQEIVPSKYRHVTIGLFDAASIVAQIMPLVSWVIIKETGNWRICYYVMIAFQAINLALLVFFYNPPSWKEKKKEHGKSAGQLLREFDWLGLFLFLAGCTLFIVGVSWGGSMAPWVSATVLAPIIIGLLTLIGLGFYEAHYALTAPLFPPRLFRALRHFTVPMLVMAIGGMQYYSNATLWPRLSQLIYAGDEISKGLYAEVLPLGTIIGGIIVTFSKYTGHQRWVIMFAVALQTACVGAMSTSTMDNPAKSIVLTVIISACTSVNLLNGMVLVGFGIVYQEDIGTAAGLAGTSRLLAGAVATAIFGNVTNNKYGDSLPERVRSNLAPFDLSSSVITQLIAAARANTAAAYAAIPGITPAIQTAASLGNRQAYLEGAHLSYLVALAFGLFGVVAAFFIPSVDKRKYTNKTVAIQEHDWKRLRGRKVAEAGDALSI
ncbi:mfs general substrate transporter [Stemphylium lycopersici]|uniref:Mfs general substrate transporter n=1 Tax=Stemphylium lycopersici TaxID=183478 RepID=A0A364MU56_STELY|nr:mfs general substrate transporter [Stemphylium lycopersici]RAR03212.1 mfs general substrate transporter [Stemphylium lycopersici]